jgi:hypothetical protein
MEIAMRGSTGECTKRAGGSILVVSGPSNAEEDGGAKKRGKQRLNSVFLVFFFSVLLCVRGAAHVGGRSALADA